MYEPGRSLKTYCLMPPSPAASVFLSESTQKLSSRQSFVVSLPDAISFACRLEVYAPWTPKLPTLMFAFAVAGRVLIAGGET